MSVNKILVNNSDSNYTHSIFDISEYTGNSYSTLSDALDDVPIQKRKGGMTIRYVQTNDNKYVQYRLMSNSFNTTPNNWQGIDDELTANSENLVTSGGVKSSLRDTALINKDESFLIGEWIVDGTNITFEGTGMNGTFTSLTDKSSKPSETRPYFRFQSFKDGAKYRIRLKAIVNGPIPAKIGFIYASEQTVNWNENRLIDIDSNKVADVRSGYSLDCVFIADSSKTYIAFSMSGCGIGDTVTISEFSLSSVEDISESVERLINDVTDAKNNLNKISFIGKGNDYSSNKYFHILQKGHIYRFSMLNTSWDIPEGISEGAYIFQLAIYDENGNALSRIVTVNKNQTIENSYTYRMPFEDNEYAYFAIGGRALDGEEIIAYFEDITDIKELQGRTKELVEHTPSVISDFAITGGGIPIKKQGWCYTENYIPCKYGDIVTVKFQRVGEPNVYALVMYNENKNTHEGMYYSTNGYTNERTVTINWNDCKYIRCSLSKENVNTCEVYINGQLVWGLMPSVLTTIDNRLNNIETDINSIRQLYLGNIVQGLINSDGIIDGSKNNRVCQEFVSSLPTIPCTLFFKLPENIKAVILSGQVAGSEQMTHDSGWIINGEHYAFPDEDLFYNIIFAHKNATEEILPNEIIGYIQSGEIEVTYKSDVQSVIERNSEATKYAKAVTLNLLNGQNQIGNMLNKMPIFAHISDLHGDQVRYLNCLEYAKWFGVDSLLVSGDSVPYHYGNGNSWLKENERYGINMLTCIGNHEVWHSQAGSNTNIFSNYIEPYVENNGYLSDTGILTVYPYYYKDYIDKQIRLIILNQYDCAVYGGQNRGGKLGQAQITWLINTLGSTPAGYGVVIMMHAYEDTLEKPSSLSEFNQKVFVSTYMNNGFYVNSIRPIMKIVDAFISRGTLDFTYTEVDSTGTTQDAETITVTADFTDVDSTTEFICYLCGHRHEDVVGYYANANNPQLVITVTSGTAHYGVSSTHAALANQEDLPRGTIGSTQDAFNIYAIDRVNKKVKIARIGSNMTFQLEYRKCMIANYKTKSV